MKSVTACTDEISGRRALTRMLHEYIRNQADSFTWQGIQRFPRKYSLSLLLHLASPHLVSATAPGVALPPPSLES